MKKRIRTFRKKYNEQFDYTKVNEKDHIHHKIVSYFIIDKFIKIIIDQARRQLNWNGGMDSQYKLLSELLSDQAAFITSP